MQTKKYAESFLPILAAGQLSYSFHTVTYKKLFFSLYLVIVFLARCVIGVKEQKVEGVLSIFNME